MNAFASLRTAASLLALATCVASARDTTPSPKVQQRIDALLKHRLNPVALPIDPPNPFVVLSGRARESSAEGLSPRLASLDENVSPASAADPKKSAPAAPTSSDVEILSGTVARLKFGGVIILKDQIKVLINGVQRREGDMVPANWDTALVYLKVVRLLPTQVVLRYGEAEATLKF